MSTFEWLKAKAEDRPEYWAYLLLSGAFVIAVLGLGNRLSDTHNKSYDSTANKRYSLSDQTEKVVKNLKQDVKITYFDETSRFDQAKDLLGRYASLSSRLNVEYFDPYRKPREARAAGVRTTPQIFVQAGTRREEAKSLTEQDVTSAIVRAVKPGERMVCAVSGSGEPSLEESGPTGYSSFKQLLERDNYKSKTISLLEQAEIPKDCTLLLVAGPRKDYSEGAVKAIKGFVEGGGRALFMLSPPLKTPKDEIADNQALVKTLEGWGVTLDKNFIADARGQRMGLGADVSVVAEYESHAIGREMKGTGTIFPLSRSMETKSADKTSVEKLFSTGGSTYATANLGPGQISIDPAKDKKGPFVIAAAGTYRTGKENNDGRFVVVGSSDWVSNGYLGIPFFGNRDLALNMMNWLSADEELISIRPKSPEDRKVTMDVQKLTLVNYTSVFIIPGLVIVIGLLVWWHRARSQRPEQRFVRGKPQPGTPLPPRLPWVAVGLVMVAGVAFRLVSTFGDATWPLYAVAAAEALLVAWGFIQARWIKQIAPGNRSLPMYLLGLVLVAAGYGLPPLTNLLFTKALSLEMDSVLVTVISLYLIFSGVVFWFVGVFRMRASLEEQYNTKEPFGLWISAPLTLFFTVVYLQYHLNRIREWKTAAVETAAAA